MLLLHVTGNTLLRPTTGPNFETINRNQPGQNPPIPVLTKLNALQKPTFLSYIILITLYAPFLAWI